MKTKEEMAQYYIQDSRTYVGWRYYTCNGKVSQSYPDESLGMIFNVEEKVVGKGYYVVGEIGTPLHGMIIEYEHCKPYFDELSEELFAI